MNTAPLAATVDAIIIEKLRARAECIAPKDVAREAVARLALDDDVMPIATKIAHANLTERFPTPEQLAERYVAQGLAPDEIARRLFAHADALCAELEHRSD